MKSILTMLLILSMAVLFFSCETDPFGDEEEEETTTSNCGSLSYNGPTEGQIMQFCQAAQLYDCEGAATERAYVCSVIADYGASCPYCN